MLSTTGETAESTIPQVQALGEAIDGLNAEYEAAKETVAATLDGIMEAGTPFLLPAWQVGRTSNALITVTNGLDA